MILGIIIREKPIQAVLYDVSKCSLKQVDGAEIGFAGKDSVIINFCEEDEKTFVKSGIRTLSMQTFLSMCSGYAMKHDDINDVFIHTAGIHYINSFCSKKTDHSLLYSSKHFWHRMGRLVNEGMDMIRQQGLEFMLELEGRTTIALRHMIDNGYPLDIEGIKQEYDRLCAVLVKTKRIIRNRNGNLPKALTLCQKTEEQIQRIPIELFCHGRSKAVLTCSVNSIGTDTCRIQTKQYNIQGLSKSVRRYLLPRHGNRIIEVDLVNSQLIILACLVGENLLIEAYAKGIDLYLLIASSLMERDITDFSRKERCAYKKMILQLINGAGISVVQKDLELKGINMSRADIRNMFEKFYRLFPKIKSFSDNVKSEKTGYIKLPTGRKWDMRWIQNYKRLSYILQYEEAVILREILVMLDEQSTDKDFWLYLCIHDSILLEMNREASEKVYDIIKKCIRMAVCKYLPVLKKINIKETIIYE